MMVFITDNLATILIGLAVLTVVALIVANMIKKKRRGQPIGCSCGCDGCCAGSEHAGHGACSSTHK